MYEGYLKVGNTEVINTHRTAAYAASAGLSWVKGCSHCSSIVAGLNGAYRTPLLDSKAGAPPPWWQAGKIDAAEFFGVMGLMLDNADDSTRKIEVIGGSAGGGHFGGLRFTTRNIVVRGIAVAANDCALGFGLNWLRGLDAGTTCQSVTTRMYECCPNVAESDCTDPTCVGKCITARARDFFNTRITSGPTVLRRRELGARGAMAEVEFVITAADPAIYGVVPLVASAAREAYLWEDPVPLPGPEPVDAFAAPVTYAIPPSLQRQSRFVPRTSWERQVIDLPAPDFGAAIAPTIRITSSEFVPSVRLTLLDGDSQEVGQWRMDDFPTVGTVTIDFRAREVTTESNGIERLNSAYVSSADGRPFQWPRYLPIGDYTLLVDRSVGTEPLEVEVAVLGAVSP